MNAQEMEDREHAAALKRFAQQAIESNMYIDHLSTLVTMISTDDPKELIRLFKSEKWGDSLYKWSDPKYQELPSPEQLKYAFFSFNHETTDNTMNEQITIESQPRATGQTTRLVDHSIQWLFQNPDCWMLVKDHIDTDMSNEYLLERIIKRLESELNIQATKDKGHPLYFYYAEKSTVEGKGSWCIKLVSKHPAAPKSSDDFHKLIDMSEFQPIPTDQIYTGKKEDGKRGVIPFIEGEIKKIREILGEKPSIRPEDRIRALSDLMKLSSQLIEFKRLTEAQPYSKGSGSNYDSSEKIARDSQCR